MLGKNQDGGKQRRHRTQHLVHTKINDRVFLRFADRVRIPEIVVIVGEHSLLHKLAFLRFVLQIRRPRQRARMIGKRIVRRYIERVIHVFHRNRLPVAPRHPVVQRHLYEHVVLFRLRIILLHRLVIDVTIRRTEFVPLQVRITPLFAQKRQIFARLLVKIEERVVDQTRNRRRHTVPRKPGHERRRKRRRNFSHIQRGSRICPAFGYRCSAARKPRCREYHQHTERKRGYFPV